MLQHEYIWQIAEHAFPMLREELKNQRRFQTPDEVKALALKMSEARAWNEYLTRTYSSDPRVLVLPIQGPMSRGGWYSLGNDTLISLLESAANDEKYSGAVLKMNTPGGTADSTPALAQAVAEFSKKKPIITSTAYCASAGYYVASQCEEIILENQAASSIGSIGTLLYYENYQKYMEKQGISVEIMRATASTEKARINSLEELTPETRAELQGLLDACQKEFAGAVKRGRVGKITSSEVFTGKMYGVKDAIRLGLADSTGTLQTAIARVLQLSK